MMSVCYEVKRLSQACIDAGKKEGEGGKSIGRKQFTELVQRTITQRRISDREVDLLYRVFDTNRDGFLSLAEIVYTDARTKPTGDLDKKGGEESKGAPLDS